jgi:TIR domain
MKEAPEPRQDVIFINYRRTDTGWSADLLAKELERIFGEDRVFLDVEGIRAGDPFAVDLDEQLRHASVLIVLIGKGWLVARDQYGRRRIDQEDDWVRREIRTGLQRHGCRVIPVLIDDADLPQERQAFPEDIAALIGLQRMRLRQANSTVDIEALVKELENAGFSRSRGSAHPAADEDFSDALVNNVATTLRQLQQQDGRELVARLQLIREIDRLFNRKTFRFEPLRDCSEQRWGDRLHSAYQTKRLLRRYERNVQEVAADKYDLYVDILREVDRYCMQMGSVLFTPPVEVTGIREHIGKATFAAHLPPATQFPTLANRKPIIPDVINDVVDRPRKRAVSLMNRFRKE